MNSPSNLSISPEAQESALAFNVPISVFMELAYFFKHSIAVEKANEAQIDQKDDSN